MAVINMSSISTKSKQLADEYLPEVRIADEIERNSLQTMYNMRGYGFTEEDRFLNEGKSFLAEVNKGIDDAQELSSRSESLVKLDAAINETDKAVREYENLVQKTIEINKTLTNSTLTD